MKLIKSVSLADNAKAQQSLFAVSIDSKQWFPEWAARCSLAWFIDYCDMTTASMPKWLMPSSVADVQAEMALKP